MDWEDIEPDPESPLITQPKTHYSTRSSTKPKSTDEHPPQKRKSQERPVAKKSRFDIRPEQTARRERRLECHWAQVQQPRLDVHLCVPNARGAFEKWPHGGLKGHTVQAFFKKVNETCGLKGRLTALTLTLSDAAPQDRHAWTVKEGDALMFEHVKEKTERILAGGKYVGIFEILVEPSVMAEEDEGEDMIVVDVPRL